MEIFWGIHEGQVFFKNESKAEKRQFTVNIRSFKFREEKNKNEVWQNTNTL